MRESNRREARPGTVAAVGWHEVAGGWLVATAFFAALVIL
jgi:hypothetical protein